MEVRGLREKIRLLQEEIKGIMIEREKERKACDGVMVVFELKEEEWKQEKKRLKGEIKRLNKVLEDKDERIREIEEYYGAEDQCQWQLQLKQMREEREWREEAVEKWKQLYLAIKIELDDLIQRTHIHHGSCFSSLFFTPLCYSVSHVCMYGHKHTRVYILVQILVKSDINLKI